MSPKLFDVYSQQTSHRTEEGLEKFASFSGCLERQAAIEMLLVLLIVQLPFDLICALSGKSKF